MSAAPLLKWNNLGSPRIIFGERLPGPDMFFPEHIERNRPSGPLRPCEDRIPVGDSNFERLFHKINLTHANSPTNATGHIDDSSIAGRLTQINVAGFTA